MKRAALLYLGITCVLTWPLATVMHKEIAADMGDPVFVSWVLLWTSGQVLAFLSGDLSALSRYWQGNIFYPEPLTLAYSEHFTAQMLQALPVLATTDNVVLSYNLLFLSTFVLSGLGVFLLVRDITGRPIAAFVAGLAFAFAPYRIDQLSHLQVLSSQWMPFALCGFRRYFETGRRRALVGGSAALIAQNLSCGYYVMFFSPFVAAYVLYELAARKRLRDWATWRALGLASIVVALVTLPFLTPYLEVRNSGVGVRSLGEMTSFSADVHGFATASERLKLWGTRLVAFPKPEGQGFPGFAILTLALVGIAAGVARRRKRDHASVVQTPSPRRQILTGALFVFLAAHLFATAQVLMMGSFLIPIRGVWAESHSAGGLLLRTAMLAVAWILVRRHPGQSNAEGARSPWGFYAVAALAAAAFALGPEISVKGLVISPGPYAWLMQYVPGFDGLRVPARYLMLMALFLSVLVGLGASALIGRARRFGTVCVLAAGVMMLAEGWPAVFPTNVRLAAGRLDITPRHLGVGKNIPPVYRAIRDSELPMVLLELPFGTAAWDLHAVYYAGYHRQRLVNGYSGFFPESHLFLVRMFNSRGMDPDATWRALLATRTTHVLVHEAAFPERERREISDWLKASGAREILVDGTDRLFIVR